VGTFLVTTLEHKVISHYCTVERACRGIGRVRRSSDGWGRTARRYL